MTQPTRAAVREAMRARRDALPPAARLAAAEALAGHLAELPEMQTDERVAGYWAVRGEVSLHRVVAMARARGQAFHLPVIVEDRGAPLRFARWHTGEPVAANRFGIPEPVCDGAQLLHPRALELVFVPLVAFDRRGHRLGTGAGFYDRSFAFLRDGERPREPLLVGVGYAFQEVAALADEPWDVPLDFVCTERELIECRR
jgi:5-formyltetrahydrofolate cyclo-ligase